MKPGTKVTHKRRGGHGEVLAKGARGWVTVRWKGSTKLEALHSGNLNRVGTYAP